MYYFKNFPIERIGSYGFKANLLTGSILVPDRPGGYVISTGTGSGKTQSIKSLIAERYNDGILYCVETRDEARKMHDWIIKELIPGLNRLDPNDPYRLTPDDVTIIDWDHAEELYNYFRNPEEIMYKKILIITHKRFYSDLIPFFVVCNPSTPVETFDGDFSTLMSRTDLRKYILFDETPNFFEPFITIASSVVTNLKRLEKLGYNTKDLERVKDWYDECFGTTFKSGSILNPFNTNTKLGKMKKDTTLSYIGNNLTRLMLNIDYIKKRQSNKGEKGDVISSIHFYPIDLLQPNMQTMVLIWEGVGDLLFSHQTPRDNYKLFDVINIQEKYNSTVVFEEYHINQKRREYITEDELKGSKLFQNHINSLAEIIMDRGHNKTLVVVWKDRGEIGYTTIPDYSRVIKEAFDSIGVDPNRYTLTYYGASDNKSTNDYKDYDAILLVGKRMLGDNHIKSLMDGYSLLPSPDLALLWFYVQLITRIGIRKHDGGNYTVYYSDDFDKKLIKNLRDHFRNTDTLTLDYDLPNVISELDEVIEIKVNKSHRENLRKLIKFYPDLKDVILKGLPGYTIKTSLKNLNRMLGLKRNSIAKYQAFVNELINRFGIILNIN